MISLLLRRTLLNLLLFVFLFSTLSALVRPPLSLRLIDSAGMPTAAFVDLMHYTHLGYNGNWDATVESMQQEWLRPKNQERWGPLWLKDPNAVKSYALFNRLGLTEPIRATRCHYTYGVVLGATMGTVEQRLLFLKHEWQRGVRFDTLVFLTGDRPLDPNIESPQCLLQKQEYDKTKWNPPEKLPTNETEMMSFVFHKMDLPKAWYKLPLIIVDAPKPKGGSRPQTADTYLAWLQMKPAKGSALLVSNQPFVGRAETLALFYLNSYGIEVDVVGEGIEYEHYAAEPRAYGVLLDELARWNFELSRMER